MSSSSDIIRNLEPFLKKHYLLPNGDFYIIYNYGYEDCGAEGPFTLEQAIETWNKHYPKNIIGGSWDVFEKRKTHYIGDCDDADEVELRSRRDESLKTTKLSEIAKFILKEEPDNVIVKNMKVQEDFDAFLAKPENKGETLYKEEFDVVDMMESKPNKKVINQIKYSSADDMTGKNKEMVVIKKQKRYVAFFSIREPTDLNNEADIPKETDANPESEGTEEAEKDTIFIKVSKPFEDQSKPMDVGLLSNFLNNLLLEFQS